MWGGLGQAATVAQLVGADVGGLISMIIQAAVTAQQNKKECEQLARRVFMIAELLPHLQDPEVMRRPEVRRPLVGLDDALREAHELVMSCQEKSATYRFVMAGRQAERFRDVERRIDSYLIVFPFISHIDITRRLDGIYKVLLPNDDMALPAPSEGSHSHELELAEEVAQEVVLHGEEGEEFTFAELEAATNNFDPDKSIGRGGSSKVYIGSLPDGREVAIKYLDEHCNYFMGAFDAERSILSSIRHEHIIRLCGCCVESHWHKETKHSLWFWKKKVVDVESVPKLLLVLEYMKNGSLGDHLHGPLLSSSPVRTSWRMRMEILLGVSRAIEYLHTLSPRPVIHRDIKSLNILLDERWAPRLFDFGISLWGDETEGTNAAGTIGYMAPDYYSTKEISPKIDVYSFGVVMLEVLAGKRVFLTEDEVQMIFNCEEDEEEEGEEANTIAAPSALVQVALPLIEAGKLRKLLDRRPGVPEPTPRQLEAAVVVAHTAARCLRLQGEERPAMSEVVANLERAVGLVLGDAR